MQIPFVLEWPHVFLQRYKCVAAAGFVSDKWHDEDKRINKTYFHM
jgi:hypothetical protein